MTSIRGYADMLAKPGLIGPLNEMQQQFVDIIRSNIIRMEGLVTDVSDLNKLQAQRYRPNPAQISLVEALEHVKKTAAPLIAEQQHTVTWQVAENLPKITTDLTQLVKTMNYLVRNALQYTRKGGTISVKIEPAGDAVRVSIADNGIGMKPEDIARLGEPFFRADHDLVTETKGYGLGIPLAKGFLALLKSELHVESAPGSGSTFSFVLPSLPS
jgi:signal transduction histidine kinase